MADSYIWEEDPVQLKVQARGVKYSNKPVKFTFKTDDANQTEVGTADVTVKDNVVAANVYSGKLDKTKKVADVGADDIFYKMKYEITVNGESRKSFTDRISVFARKINVTAVDAADQAKKFVGAICRLTQQPALGSSLSGSAPAYVSTRETDKDGKIEYSLFYPSTALMLEWVRPYYGEWLPGKDKGIAREAKITYAPKAKLEFPSGGDEGVSRQYVNLAEDTEPDLDKRKRDRGRILHVAVVLEKPSEWVAGQKCFLKATFGANNSDRIGAVKKKGETLELETTFGVDKKATFDINLGPAGGDEVAIEVGTFKGKADDKCKVQTWRQLYYELMAPQAMVDAGSLIAKKKCEDGSAGFDLPAAAVGWCDKRLAQGFVEYKLWKSHIFGNDLADDFVVPAAYVKRTGGDVYVLGGVYDSVARDPMPFSAAESRTVHVRFCDIAGDAEAPASASKTTSAVEVTFKTGGDHLFKKSLADGAASITNAKWTAKVARDAMKADGTTPHPGTKANGRPKSGVIAADWFTYVNSKEVKVTLQGDAAALVGALDDDHCPIKISFDWVLCSELCGSAFQGRQLLGNEAQPKFMASTICHELGHAMGMTVFPSDAQSRKKVTPEGMPEPKVVPAGPYYDDSKGHQGSHCADGVDYGAASFENTPEGSCIMFGSGSPADEPKQGQFCTVCRTYLKSRKLEDIRSTWRTRSADQA